MRSLLQDLRHSLRRLGRSPGLSAVVILTVAAGIAASATVFALVDALFFKPLPGVSGQSQLVNVHATAPDGSTFHSVSLPTWRDLGDGGGSFAGLAAFSSRLASLSDGGEPRLAVLQMVTGNYFQLLGTRPALGRFFGPAEDAVPGRDAVAVLGHGAWKSRFGGDSSIVGRQIQINGKPFTVLGVAGPGFAGTFLGIQFDAWIPSMMASALAIEDRLEAREHVWLEMVGRLAPGVTLASAQSRMNELGRRLERAYPDSQRGIGYDLRPTTGFEDDLRGAAVGFFAVLSALGGLVLAVACVNVTGVLLARGLTREKELGLRMALGSGRGRLVRLLLIETLALFAVGGALGALLTTATTPLLERFRLPIPLPLVFDFSPGPRVVGFALLAAAVGGLLFGLVAALATTRHMDASLLRSGAATERRAAARLRSAFVSVQVAGSVLLLVTAGLFLRTVKSAASADPGFASDGLSLTRIDLSMLGYDEARARSYYDQLLERVTALPGVSSATIAGVVPLGPGNRTATVALPGRTAEEDRISVDFSDVGESYFATMGIPILRGRAFGREDAPGAPFVAIVNQTLAARLWPGRDPIGQTLTKKDRTLTVVGVARDGKYRRLSESPRSYLYTPSRQEGRVREDLVVRSEGPRRSPLPRDRRRDPEARARPSAGGGHSRARAHRLLPPAAARRRRHRRHARRDRPGALGDRAGRARGLLRRSPHPGDRRADGARRGSGRRAPARDAPRHSRRGGRPRHRDRCGPTGDSPPSGASLRRRHDGPSDVLPGPRASRGDHAGRQLPARAAGRAHQPHRGPAVRLRGIHELLDLRYPLCAPDPASEPRVRCRRRRHARGRDWR